MVKTVQWLLNKPNIHPFEKKKKKLELLVKNPVLIFFMIFRYNTCMSISIV